MKKSIILISLILSVITAQPGGFSVPNVISFQGMLTNVDGSVYQDGDYELTFRFIRTMQDGSEQIMWEEAHTASVSSGVFSVILGSNTPLPQYISGNAMLETQVGDEILSPRQPFTSVPFSLRANGAQFSEQALRSDSSNFAQTSHHSVFADTSAFALNAPTAINATHATYADTSMVAVQSQHSEHADTASFALTSNESNHSQSSEYVLNAPPPISVYDEFWSINNSSTFNTTSSVVVVDTIFEQPLLKFYLQGLINYNGNQNSAKTEIFFAPYSDFGEEDGDVYLLDENPNYREEPRKLRLIGQYYNASQDSDDMNNPQISFFFYIKPELQNTPHRLVIKKASGSGSNDMVMWGKFWGQ